MKELENIELEYQKSIQNKKIDLSFEMTIKGLLSKLRSVLDYLANQIASENSSIGKKASFPIYSESSHRFKRFMKEKFPRLEKKNPSLFQKLESIQYYNDPSNNSWMKDLSILDNAYKHVKPIQQKLDNGRVVVQGKGITVIAGEINMGRGGSIIDADGSVLKGPIKLTKDSKSFSVNDGLMVTIVQDEIKFAMVEKSVLPTLHKILSGVKNTIQIFDT